MVTKLAKRSVRSERVVEFAARRNGGVGRGVRREVLAVRSSSSSGGGAVLRGRVKLWRDARATVRAGVR